jgi:hypothetical protein
MKTRFHWLCSISLFGAMSGCAADVETSPEPVAASANALSTAGYSSVAFEELTTASGEPVAGATLADLANHLDLLKGRGIALVLHWKAETIDDPQRWDIVDAALARGIPVWPWLTLPEDNPNDPSSYSATGYFPNATNYEAWTSYSQYLMFLWRQRELPPTTMVVDMELRKERLIEFQKLTNSGASPTEIRDFLRVGVDPTRYANAMQGFKDYVNYAHSLGFRASFTTLLPILDDYNDGDDSYRQAFGVPLENNPNDASATPWDEISFQAQRSLYQKSYPGMTSFFVYDYALMARRIFGERAGVGLGETDAGISVDPSIVYKNGDELRLDVEAALAAGVPGEKIGVYSFLGMYQRPPAESWFQAPQTTSPPARDSLTNGTQALHNAALALDLVL